MNFLSKIKLKSLRKKVNNLHNKRERGENIDVKYEIKAQKELGKFYDKHRFDKKLPNAEILANECYRAAALLGDSVAQYIFAERQLQKGKFWDEFAQGIYGRDIHKTYATNAYEEGFNYLKEADASGSPLAKRLHGLAYINGWGVEVDQDKGFKLVVDSIEEENAWDRATQIFEESGLNKPEFFSAIMTLKQKRT